MAPAGPQWRIGAWPAAFALTAAVAAGMLFFWGGGAPHSYMALNGAMLVAALAIMLAIPAGWLGARGSAWAACICLAGLGATLVSGFDLDGVRRWLPLGPVQLHAGMLLLPAMAAALPRLSDGQRFAAVAMTAGVILYQPDLASGMALLGALALSQAHRWRARVAAAGIGVALLAVVGTALRGDTLAAIRFVEHVAVDGWALNPAIGLLIFAAILVAVIAPLRLIAVDREGALSVSGAWAGFTVASMIGAYPTPFAGYGAAAILGYGLSIAVLRGQAEHR